MNYSSDWSKNQREEQEDEHFFFNTDVTSIFNRWADRRMGTDPRQHYLHAGLFRCAARPFPLRVVVLQTGDVDELSLSAIVFRWIYTTFHFFSVPIRLFDSHRHFYHVPPLRFRAIPLSSEFCCARDKRQRAVFCLQPFGNWFGLTPLNKKKFPESAWKCFFYSCTWSYCVNLLMYRYDYFARPYDVWDGQFDPQEFVRSFCFPLDWSAKMVVPFDIQVMYFVQCGFYLHSIYATVYMDYKRKDFYVMLLHHIVTMALILVSYATR